MADLIVRKWKVTATDSNAQVVFIKYYTCELEDTALDLAATELSGNDQHEYPVTLSSVEVTNYIEPLP